MQAVYQSTGGAVFEKEKRTAKAAAAVLSLGASRVRAVSHAASTDIKQPPGFITLPSLSCHTLALRNV